MCKIGLEKDHGDGDVCNQFEARSDDFAGQVQGVESAIQIHDLSIAYENNADDTTIGGPANISNCP